MQDQIEILTPEKVAVSMRVAGLGTRTLAQIFDLLVMIVLAIGAISTWSTTPLAQLENPIFTAGWVILFTTYPFLYFILQEMFWDGQTVGKKLLSIRVRMADGTPITARAALTRNLLRVGDFLPGFYLFGFVFMVITPRFQRMGDLAAGTVVVADPPRLIQFTPAPHRAGLHPLEHHLPHLRGMSMSEYRVLKHLADRFPYLTPDAQEKHVRQIWGPFAKRHGVPEVPNVHPMYLIEAVVMKYGRLKKLV